VSETAHCCDRMKKEVARTSAKGADGSDDPDSLVVYIAKFNEYGINVHDGGASYVLIMYCPWCGARLPDSKRDQWFEELERQGLNPWTDTIPDAYQSDAWFRS
jgi:hypothetical protein